MPDSSGYDAQFLGLTVPLPDPAARVITLDYVHFTVELQPDRRLAAVTGVNIHGGLLTDIERKNDTWLLDPRAPADAQAGPALYARNDFDRGHLVRRRDPGWGTASTAKSANDDTFHYSNAAPQAAVLNQSKDLWAGLEDYLLDHAATYDQRLAVFTGPVLLVGDPVYRGVQIPLRFFKIAAWLDVDQLACTGYVLDQTHLVPPILAQDSLRAPGIPPLGAFKTFQVPLQDIADLTGLQMPELLAADRVPTTGTGAAVREHGWLPLTSTADIRLPQTNR